MKIEIRVNSDDSSAYDLVVDGEVRVVGETFTICDNVRDSLLGRGCSEDYSEADEIADNIARR